jgi:hypothetical protein
MKYFSIDYRSPPSGMGQIIDDTQPETIIDRLGKEQIKRHDSKAHIYVASNGHIIRRKKAVHQNRLDSGKIAGHRQFLSVISRQ